MARVKGLMESWPIFALSLAWLALLAGLHLWPASYWMDVRSISIADARQGDSPQMAVVREIKHDFVGEWRVTVRQWDGGWVVWCNASGSNNYREDAKLPTNLTLKWWTDGQCHPLDTGKYIVSTSWTRQGVGLIPDKLISVESNIFEVRP